MKQRKMPGAFPFRHRSKHFSSIRHIVVGHINPFGNPPSAGAGLYELKSVPILFDVQYSLFLMPRHIILLYREPDLGFRMLVER
jgi:hypothetical protein